ncbi:MAG: NUDIX domain-containing protein [Pseudomonadota bacterium]
MSRIFLLDPLAAGPLLQEVLGQPPMSRVLVEMEGVGVTTLNTAFPMPHVDETGRTTATAIDIEDAGVYDRLSFFAQVLGAHPVPKHGTMDGEEVSGILFVTDAPSERIETDWAHDPAGTAVLAAREIMGYYGRLPAQDVAGRMSMILSRAAATCAAMVQQPPETRSATPHDAVTVHAQEATHEGFFLTRTYDLQHPRFDGTISPRLSREVFIGTDAVIVLPYDPVRDRVLLVEQFRMGPFARGDTYPWVLEPVAGRVDAGETPETAVRRECEEEAGLTLSSLEHVTSHYCSPGASSEFFHCYIAFADLPDEAAGLGGVASEHEDIRTHILSFDQAMGLLSSGEANIGPMILLLLWLDRERPRLRGSA